MKLRVQFEQGDLKVDETVEGGTAEQVVAAMQHRVSQEAPFLVRAVIRAMSPLKFAQEVTKRYNAARNDTVPPPATCEDFIRVGVEKGFATLLEGELR